MPAANVIRLRALLSEKFSGLRLRTGLETAAPAASKCWPTGLAILDEPLQGGLPRGGLSEIISPSPSCGSATLMHDLLRRAAGENQIIAVIDGSDSLDVTQLEENVQARLLWVRAHSADEALKAADFILRDSNVSLVMLDLKLNSEKELRKIPPTTWYRFQRLIEQTAMVCVVLTPRPLVVAKQARVTLRARFPLAAMESDTDKLLRELKLEIAEARQLREIARQHVA